MNSPVIEITTINHAWAATCRMTISLFTHQPQTKERPRIRRRKPGLKKYISIYLHHVGGKKVFIILITPLDAAEKC